MKVIIDRFEGNYALCEKEDRTMIDIEKPKLPNEAKEGDVLNILDGKVTIDYRETAKMKAEIEDLTKDLWE